MREWVRSPQWASPAFQAAWEPEIRRLGAAWREIEVGSVEAGVRPAALLTVEPNELPALSDRAARAGLGLSILAAQPIAEGYTAGVPEAGRPGLRVAFHAGGWDPHSAWAAGDDRIGQLLGFPACCRAFFARTWGAGARDTTPAMDGAARPGPVECNILLRWIGVRLVPHLPCAFDCEASAALGRAMVAATGSEGVVVAAQEMLAWHTEYSAVNGVGIVTTPAFRFAFSSDPSSATTQVLRPGGRPPAPESPSWVDNGFATREAMESAHAVVVGAVKASGFTGGQVLDLGCGDGTLLARIAGDIPGTSGVGVETDEGRVRRGAGRYPALRLVAGRIENFRLMPAEWWDLVLLMPGRLTEMGARGNKLAQLLPRVARRIVTYAYGDWLSRATLEDLVAEAGVPRRVGAVVRAAGVSAGALEMEG